MLVPANLASTSSGTGMLVGVLNIWLAVWAIRRKGEFDYELDKPARLIRWSMVGIGFGLIPRVPNQWAHAGDVRISLGVLAMAFLCWPNFAYRLRRLFGGPTSGQPAA
jgi:hypothetical protein